MNYARFAAKVLTVFFKIRYPRIRTEVLGPQHCAAAAELLSREFCRREPLCQQLGMTFDEIQPFFKELVQQVAQHNLAVVALNHKKEVIGVVTIEDHFDRLEPNDLAVDGLNAIGEYLDTLKLPENWQVQKRGQLFHCGLAAVSSAYKNSAILSILILFTYAHLKKLGYKSGYCKITNAAITKRFKALEKMVRSEVFSCVSTARPAQFKRQGKFPFRNYLGQTYLFAWILP